MIIALYILLALVVAGAILKLTDRPGNAPEAEDVTAEVPAESECCGMHITCERDSLLVGMSDRIEYYDDEELDVFVGRDADSYSDGEIEQFRDVLLTLIPDDIAPWARSIQLRGITLPPAVRDELLLLVAEARAARSQNHSLTDVTTT